jgi:CheY-like chemotaxis protein
MKKVLLVDDDDAMLFAFRKLCTASGVSAETADSSESALSLLSREHYDILISDLNLTRAGGHQGFEIVRAAKRYNPLIRAYIWTAYDGKLLRDKAAETGIEGFLTKPVKFDTLLSLINDDSTAGD